MKRFLIIVILSLFTLPVWAENTILIVGDSLSSGLGIDIQQGWASLLQERLTQKKWDYRVINDSIAGDTTSNGIARIEKSLQQYHPEITIIELGGNDGLRGLPLTEIKSNLTKMIQLAKEKGSQVVILGVRLPPNYGPLYTQGLQQLYASLAKQENIAVVPLFLQGIDDHPGLMQADGIHPTQSAQAIMLNNVWPVLEKLINKH